MGKAVRLGEVPPAGEKPPDPDKPYAWIGGRWVLLASDTADGVPGELFAKPRRAKPARGSVLGSLLGRRGGGS